MIRLVVVLVIVAAVYRRIVRRGKDRLGLVATISLGVIGATACGVLAASAVGGSGVGRDLAAGFAGFAGAVGFVLAGEFAARRRPRPVRR